MTSNSLAKKMEKHYCDLFNCVRSSSFKVDENDNNKDGIVCSQEMYYVHRTLKENKTWDG